MAQVVERVVEPFSNSSALFTESQKGNGQNNAAKGGNDAEPAGDPPNDKGGANTGGDDTTQYRRTVGLWFFASALGIILCYSTVGFFQMVQITFNGAGTYGHALDSVLSGVIVGSGTKPLHDLIGYIETKNT